MSSSKTNTSDLMAMLEKARVEEEERRQRMAQRRVDTSREAIRQRLANERDDFTAPDSNASDDANGASGEEMPSPTSAAVLSTPTESAGTRPGRQSIGSSSATAAPIDASLRHHQSGLDETVAELRLELNRKSTEATHLLSRTQQLESQLRHLEAIAQEKHMEVQRLTAEHEEELAGLRRELQEAEAAARRQADPKQCIREGVLITKDELLHVKQDIELQEKIVSALQKENESLLIERKAVVARLKKLELGTAQSEARAGFVAQSGALSHDTSRADLAPSAGVQSSNFAGTSGASLPQVQQQLTDLRLELQRSSTSEAELRLLVDQLRKEKRDLEKRAAAGDATRAEAAELESRSLKVQLKRQDAEHTEIVNDMARKISWYVEHQEFNRAQEVLIQEQQETIQQLRLKLMEAESLVTKSGVVRTDKDKQIRTLQRQISELEEVIREKYPNSIAQLIRSCQPPIQHSAAFKEMQAKMDHLTRELEDRDRQAQTVIDRLRVESDKVRAQYHSRLEALEEEMKTRVLHAQTRKVRELEKQLAEARKYYSEKLKDQETTIMLLRRGIASGSGGSSVKQQDAMKQRRRKAAESESALNTSVAASPTDDEEAIEGAPQGGTKEPSKASSTKPPTINHQHHSMPVKSESSASPTTEQVAALAAAMSLQNENAALKSQLEAMSQFTTQNLSPFTGAASSTSFHLAATLQGQLQVLQGELLATRRLLQDAQECLRTRSEQYEDQIRLIRQQFEKDTQLRAQQHDQQFHQLEERHRGELKLVLDRADSIVKLGPKSGMNDNHDGHTPTATSSSSVQQYLALVTERLQLLEHRQIAREVDAKREIDEIRKVSQFEALVERQKFDLIVEQKNQEILKFRSELDRLLADMAQLQIGLLT